MINGFFRMAYTGASGSGFGIIVLRDGSVAGADVAGGTYDGNYTENPKTDEISLNVTLAMPAGLAPVQTGIPLTAPARVPITATLLQADLNAEKPILIETPLGPVNVIFKKIKAKRQESVMSGPREIFEQQFKDAAAEGAIVELRMRLLADKVPALQTLAHAEHLVDVETLIVEHFFSALKDDEKEALRLCRQLRNKVLHCNFHAARKALNQLGVDTERGNVKKIDIRGPTAGDELVEKINSATRGDKTTFTYVADSGDKPGSVYGWLMEAGEAGDFIKAAAAFKEAAAIIDRLANNWRLVFGKILR
jgi:hypothetical protein